MRVFSSDSRLTPCWGFYSSPYSRISVFPLLERWWLLSSHSANRTVLQKHRVKGSHSHQGGSEWRHPKWKTPASRTAKRNGKINVYFSAEEKTSSVLEWDSKFVSTPRRERGRGGRVPDDKGSCEPEKVSLPLSSVLEPERRLHQLGRRPSAHKRALLPREQEDKS